MWWIVGTLLFLVAGVSVFTAFRSPNFVAGLITAAFNAILPALLKRKTPEEEAKDHQVVREGGTPKMHMPGPKRRK